MGRAEGVVLALSPLGEAGQAAALAQGADAVAAAGQELVGVGLVADVPDQDVAGRGVDGVQGHGELHHGQAAAQVPARLAHGVDHLRTRLVGQLAQLGDGEAAEVGRELDGVEERGVGGHTTSGPGLSAPGGVASGGL